MKEHLSQYTNLFLILVICLCLVFISIGAVVFQSKIVTLTADKDSFAQHLSSCTQSVASLQTQLDVASNQVVSAKGDVKKYDTLFETKVAELSNTTVLLNQTSKDLGLCKSLYNAGLLQITYLNSSLQQRSVELLISQQTLTSTTANYNKCSSDLTYCRSSLKTCLSK